ncbi:hypothetical protein V6Z11_D04G037300 [Gossypium hirsutum]|uniref:Uncharacterized protein isoform X2 n=1 Tax=Gossypium hirsutum TaxID=3635 RepID=A0ABM2ZYH3_GOSHI|nr:uncharacterized protein LOC121203467 isoform X2 [Gossypium hirsutum]
MASSIRKIGMSKWKQGKRRSSRLSGVLDACKAQQSQKMALYENITKGPYDDKAAPSIGYTLIQDQPSSMPEKPILEHFLDILQRRDTYEIFAEPVDPEKVEGYYEIIKEPMDFGTMRAKLHEGMYTSLQQFEVHQDVFCQLVDLIGITSIMEVLVRLVAADDHVYPNFSDVMQWLANRYDNQRAPEVHANAAETLCAITQNVPSALATKLSSPSFVARIFGHALEDSHSKSGLVNSLSVCISLLDPKRSAINSPLMYSFRNQLMYDPPIPVNSETINAMLPELDKMSRRTYEYDEDVSTIATSVVIVYCINIFIILTFL